MQTRANGVKTVFGGTESGTDFPRGTMVGQYKVLAKIGEGGMGQVYKARHTVMNRVVALKVLPTGSASRAEHRFRKEVQAIAKLCHPNIVVAHDAGDDNGVHFLVMEYIGGRNLRELLKTHGPFPVKDAVNYVTQAADGLQYIHSKGIVHRDVKPSNLALTEEGTIKVLDLGLALMENDDSDDLTKTGDMLGTGSFMAPEQALDTSRVDHRADIYSLGCTLFCLLTGKAPFSGNSAMKKVAEEKSEIPSIKEQISELPVPIERIYQRMLAKLPADRYQTMAEVATDLRQSCWQRLPIAKALPVNVARDSRNRLVARIACEKNQVCIFLTPNEQ